MKLNVYAFDQNENEHQVIVNVRRDASMKTKFFRCAQAMAQELRLYNRCQSITWSASLPNVWTNGYCGTCTITGDGNSYFLTIEEENGAVLAY